MSHKQIKVSIAIPTYNGEAFIAESIESVLSQLGDIPNQTLEIVVSDNASTDNTSEIVKNYVKMYPDVVLYFKNSQNIGYDHNVNQLFKIARGDYVWLLGDDDMLVYGALKRFFSILQKVDDVAIFVFSTSFLNIGNGKKFWDPQFEEDMLFSNGDDFFQKSLWATAAISSLCIRKSEWNFQRLDQYFGSQWIHIGGIAEIMSVKKNAYIFAEETVIVRIENPRWNGHFGNRLESSFKYLKMLELATSQKYAPSTFRHFLDARYADNLMGILFTKPSNFKSKVKLAKSMMYFFKFKIGFWLFHLPVLFAPNLITDTTITFLRRVKLFYCSLRTILKSN